MFARAFCFLAIFQMALLKAYSFDTVVVDAGHGGWDRGGIPGQKIAEKTMTLDVAKRLASCLEERGFKVVMTRTDDTFVSLAERSRIANQTPNSIFLSIHFDAYTDRDANGITTYFSSSSARDLASQIHRQNCAALDPLVNRGLKRDPFYVLRHSRNPAVLVELGYLTGAADSRRILNPDYRQSAAEAIANGITRYHDANGPKLKRPATEVASANL